MRLTKKSCPTRLKKHPKESSTMNTFKNQNPNSICAQPLWHLLSQRTNNVLTRQLHMWALGPIATLCHQNVI